METVGAAVVAECANQYGDLQDEVGLVTDHRLFSVYLFHSVCVCYIHSLWREFWWFWDSWRPGWGLALRTHHRYASVSYVIVGLIISSHLHIHRETGFPYLAKFQTFTFCNDWSSLNIGKLNFDINEMQFGTVNVKCTCIWKTSDEFPTSHQSCVGETDYPERTCSAFLSASFVASQIRPFCFPSSCSVLAAL